MLLLLIVKLILNDPIKPHRDEHESNFIWYLIYRISCTYEIILLIIIVIFILPSPAIVCECDVWRQTCCVCAHRLRLPVSAGPGVSLPERAGAPCTSSTGSGWPWPPCGPPPCRGCSRSCSYCRCCWRCFLLLLLLHLLLLHHLLLHSSGCCCCWERSCWSYCWLGSMSYSSA